MKYISATKGTIIAFIVFAFIYIYTPVDLISLPGTEVILTISTFLFAIIAGFFISRLSSRFDSIRSLVAQEDALLLSIYKTSQFFGAAFSKRIASLIDKYYIEAYDVPLTKYVYMKNAVFYMSMWDEARKLKKKGLDSLLQTFMNQLQSLESSRNTASVISRETMGLGHWIILIVLVFIILISLSILRTNEIASIMISILFSSALILILLIMRDLQNFMLGGQQIVEDSGQEVLGFIGKLHYYNKHLVNSGISSISKDLKEYRLGLHEPGEEKKKIIVIKAGKR